MIRFLAALLIVSWFSVASAQDERPPVPAAKDERDAAVRKASAAFEKAKKAADDKYVAALKVELTAATKKGDLDRANRIDREMKSVGDTAGPPRFDLRKAITVARYSSDARSFDVSETIARLATENKVEIPRTLWSLTHKDPKPGGGPKFLDLSFDCGGYTISLHTELPDDISPTVTVEPKSE